ncbi:MAG: hypothetical protein FWF59_14825 [Turicibacter sp.]|nr:hypothetical protein [Turicibacter sp.]
MDVKKRQDPFLVISLLFLAGTLVIGFMLYQNLSQAFQNEERQSNLHLAEEDEKFHYIIPQQATEFQEGIFGQLLQAKENGADTRELAGLVVQNFVADFFTWSNKEGRHDVGGLQFIASDIRQNFRQAAIDGFYLYLNQYLETLGPEGLMEVNSVSITNVDVDYQWAEVEMDPETLEELTTYLPVIRVEAQWAYRGGFWDFQREAVFYLTHEDGYLSIRSMMAPDEEEAYG